MPPARHAKRKPRRKPPFSTSLHAWCEHGDSFISCLADLDKMTIEDGVETALVSAQKIGQIAVCETLAIQQL